MTDLGFWRHIFADHASFITKMIFIVPYQQAAEEIKARLNALDLRTGAAGLVGEARALSTLLTQISDTQKQQYVGIMFPSLLEHMKDEEAWFERELAPVQPSLGETCSYWLQHDESAIQLTIKFIDPSETTIEDQLTKAADYLQETLESRGLAAPGDYRFIQNTIDQLSAFNSQAESLRAMLRDHQLRSILTDELIQHEEEESRYGLAQIRARAS